MIPRETKDNRVVEKDAETKVYLVILVPFHWQSQRILIL
jgi:hypothetical protein